jgi:tRNA A-37 threonylcarbamoyl transferase component Bud32
MPFFCIHCRAEIDAKYKACPFCGEPITEFLRRYLDAPIDGKYKILSRLGVGGMGEVYKVLHIHLNAIRVIKLMRANIVNDAGAHDRFQREARLATRIQHPNVAALFDFSTLDEGSRYMVWEYIEGINLHELIDSRGPLSPRYAATLAVQTLHGLEAIHRAGIVHRDVSPENLMIARDQDGDEKVKIIDLGIAKQWSGEPENQTKAGMFVGKWKYCSPEHLGLLRDGERIDGRADLYSFGIVLYEMLTGVPPFQAEMPHEYLMMHSTEMPRPLREVNPSVTASPELEALIFRALRKERMRRFRSAGEFAHELEKLIPRLDDTAGAAAVARVTAENTAAATRMMPRQGEGRLEPIDVDQASLTVHTDVSIALSESPAIATPRPRRLFPFIVPLAVIAALAIGAATMLQNRSEPLSIAPRPRRVDASVVAIAQGHLGINAYPWANVTSIRNLDSGRTVALKVPLVTPAPIDLAPGRYELTLSNPAYPKPIVKMVDVKAGQEQTLYVPFADASQLTLPKLTGSLQ